MSLNDLVIEKLEKQLKAPRENDQEFLNNALRLLAKWRHHLIQNTFVQHHGTEIINGPFKGLKFLSGSIEGCYVPKLLGCYEQPLHPVIKELRKKKYEFVINIGSAEGYYAAGLGRLLPDSRILAYDLDEKVRDPIKKLLKENNITNCTYSDNLFSTKDFKKYSNKKTLIICDIEGAEKELLDQEKAPELALMDIIVEVHDCFIPNLSRILSERFSSTHEISLITDKGDRNIQFVPKWFENLAHLDQLISFWEWRSGPTPWLIMNSLASKKN